MRMVDSAWWLRVATPAGGELGTVDVYPLGDSLDGDVVDRAVAGAREAHSIPDDMGPGWDLSVTSGPLHRDLINGYPGGHGRPATPAATVHDTAPGV